MTARAPAELMGGEAAAVPEPAAFRFRLAAAAGRLRRQGRCTEPVRARTSPYKRAKTSYLGPDKPEVSRMADLSAFPDHDRAGPPQHPDRIQLYSLPTPNGVKVSIMLEETGPALRAAHRSISARTRPGRPNSCRSTRTARSRRSSIPTARAASRSACSNRARSWSISPRRPASSCRPTRPARYETLAVGVVPDGGDRADVRPARLLPQIRRQGLRGQAPARPLRRRIEAPARRAGDAARRPRLDHGRRLHASPTSRCSAGSATSSASTAREIADYASLKHVPAWLERGLARPAVQRGLEIPARPA